MVTKDGTNFKLPKEIEKKEHALTSKKG